MLYTHCAFVAMQLPFPGTLYITAQHTCFSSCTTDGQEIVVKLQHRNVTAANKVQPRKRGQLMLCLSTFHGMQRHGGCVCLAFCRARLNILAFVLPVDQNWIRWLHVSTVALGHHSS